MTGCTTQAEVGRESSFGLPQDFKPCSHTGVRNAFARVDFRLGGCVGCHFGGFVQGGVKDWIWVGLGHVRLPAALDDSTIRVEARHLGGFACARPASGASSETTSAGASSMSTTAPAFGFDFFISRRGTVAAEAQEVADILQSEGYRVLVQDYDAALGGMFRAVHRRRADQGAAPARAALRRLRQHALDPAGVRELPRRPRRRAAERRIGVLRCDAADPRGLLSGVVYGDLHGVTDPAERRRIVLAVARGEAPAARPRRASSAAPCRWRTGCSPAATTCWRRCTRRSRPRTTRGGAHGGADPGRGARAGRRGLDLAGPRLRRPPRGRLCRRVVGHRRRPARHAGSASRRWRTRWTRACRPRRRRSRRRAPRSTISPRARRRSYSSTTTRRTRSALDRTGTDVTQTVIRFVVDTRQVEAPISP